MTVIGIVALVAGLVLVFVAAWSAAWRARRKLRRMGLNTPVPRRDRPWEPRTAGELRARRSIRGYLRWLARAGAGGGLVVLTLAMGIAGGVASALLALGIALLVVVLGYGGWRYRWWRTHWWFEDVR